jgi:chromate transporter
MFVAIEKLLKKGVRDLPGILIFIAALALSLFTDLSTVILVILAGVAGYVIFVLGKRKDGEQA